jgi:hypothetical protein
MDNRVIGQAEEPDITCRQIKPGTANCDGMQERHSAAWCAAADHRRCAEQHRPTDRAAIHSAILGMTALGLRARDIGVLLRLSEAAVIELAESGA